MNISIVIITNGKRLDVLHSCIKSAIDISDDIILVGNIAGLENYNITLIDATDLAEEGNIGKMRNIGADAASGDYIINCDDDIIFSICFKKHFKNFITKNQDLEAFTTKVIGSTGGRYWDRPVHYNGESWMIDYDAPYDNNLYYSGAFIIRKRQFANKYKWDENLGFYKNEDVIYSKKITLDGFKINVDVNNYVIHLDDSYTSYRNNDNKLVVHRGEPCPFKNEIYNDKLFREIKATTNHYKIK